MRIKNIRKIGILLSIMLLLICFLPMPVQAATVKLNKTKVTIYVGSTVKLKLTGTKKKIKWSSSKKSIASVTSKGKVSGKKPGKAIVKAKVGKKSYRCKITVKNPYLNKTSLELEVGKTETLTLKGTKVKSWTSSNPKIVTINQRGTLVANEPGEVRITCLGKNKKLYQCIVFVKKNEEWNSQYPKQNQEENQETEKDQNQGEKPENNQENSWENNQNQSYDQEHTYEKKILKEGNCSESGVASYVCIRCGDGYEEEFFGEHKLQQINIPATCIRYGESYTECTICGWYCDYVSSSILEHDTVKTVVSPSCEESGYTLYTCKNCDTSYQEDFVSPLGHDYEEVILQQADCAQCGEVLYDCRRCENAYSDITEPKHQWSTSYVAPTCKAVGGTLKTCILCQEEYFDGELEEMIPHDYVADFIEPTCCDWGGLYYQCQNCEEGYWGEDSVEPIDHEYETKVIYEATCQTVGRKEDVCKLCGIADKNTIEEIPKLEHPAVTLEKSEEKYQARCTACNDYLFSVSYRNQDFTATTQKMAYAKNHVIHVMPGLYVQLVIEHYSDSLQGEEPIFSLVLKDGAYRQETVIHEYEGQEKTEETFHYYKNDVAEVSYSQVGDNATLIVKGKNKGTTTADFCFKGEKIGEISVSTDGYTLAEAVRRQLAGEADASLGYSQTYRDMVDNTVAIFQEVLTENMTTVEKVSALCDWLEDNVEYGSSKTTMGGQKAWETLAVRQAVCGGYAQSVSFFMDVLELPCYYMVFTPPDELGHAWNMIQMDTGNGKGTQWYYVDTTWGERNFHVTVDEMNQENSQPGLWGLHRATGGYMLGNAYYVNVGNDLTMIDPGYLAPLYE